jgi:hypothetical protein
LRLHAKKSTAFVMNFWINLGKIDFLEKKFCAVQEDWMFSSRKISLDDLECITIEGAHMLADKM